MGIAESVLAIIVGILKAIPVLDSWFQQIAEARYKQALADHEQSFTDGMQKLLQSHDQSGLEEAIGSSNAGAPSSRRDGVQERDSK